MILPTVFSGTKILLVSICKIVAKKRLVPDSLTSERVDFWPPLLDFSWLMHLFLSQSAGARSLPCK
jgi:hypothetical protein